MQLQEPTEVLPPRCVSAISAWQPLLLLPPAPQILPPVKAQQAKPLGSCFLESLINFLKQEDSLLRGIWYQFSKRWVFIPLPWYHTHLHRRRSSQHLLHHGDPELNGTQIQTSWGPGVEKRSGEHAGRADR